MNEEKMKILKMLEDGRVSAEDAARLLESLRGESSSRPSPEFPKSETYGTGNNGPSSGPAASGRFDNIASDISKTFEALAKDMGPMLQKFTEVAAEKTASAADKLSKTLIKEAAPREPSYSYHTPAPDQGLGSAEKMHEIAVTPGYNELNITGLNGNVTIKGYNGDKITAKVYAKPKSGGFSRGSGDVELMKLGSKYTLHYNEDLFEQLSVDAYVPETLFQNITIGTNNGTLDVTTLSGANINISNSNGHTQIQNITADNLVVDCNNGRLELGRLFARNGQIENFNGDVSVTDLDINNLKLTGLNGSLTLLLRFFERYAEYAWAVETSNGSLTVNLPSGTEYGYHIKGQAALGQIKMGLTGLNYTANSPSYVEAQSFNLRDSRKKMKLSLETSNGPLTIN